jgi:2-dehydro-3-deoxygluconokinase
MVDWLHVLQGSKLFHTSGITFGLAAHSEYEENYLLQCFQEAMTVKPADCLVGLDYNYRATLWDMDQCKKVMEPLLTDHVDVLVTSIEDMAFHYNIGCGQYSAEAIRQGELEDISDEDFQDFARQVIERFNLKKVAVTRRYACNFERHEWESMAMDAAGNFYRSLSVKSIVLLDRLGGGDSWNAGFYYGLLTADSAPEQLEKGILVGDALTRLQQTIMFDLATISKEEVKTLMKTDIYGGGNRVAR